MWVGGRLLADPHELLEWPTGCTDRRPATSHLIYICRIRGTRPKYNVAMGPLRRLTAPTVAVLRVLVAADDPVWGLRIVKMTGLKAGSVYPILSRLEDGGWITGEWEADGLRSGARRRLYRLTKEGEREAALAVSRFDESVRPATTPLRPQPHHGLA